MHNFILQKMYKKWSFRLRISPVNVAKSAGICDLVTLTGEILNEKLHFFMQWNHFRMQWNPFLLTNKGMITQDNITLEENGVLKNDPKETTEVVNKYYM